MKPYHLDLQVTFITFTLLSHLHYPGIQCQLGQQYSLLYPTVRYQQLLDQPV